MAKNSNLEQKTSFKKYMHIQIRYIKFISYVLDIDTINAIDKFALIYKEKFYKKHNYTWNGTNR